ncbi:hypothetical protein ACFOON_15260 [Novosphingobium piscinae]|uniref:PRTRC system protein F n=1 Tax=Novosphingobium piscinae TaxID=1507448 RepID=A0A7X1KPI2_9SPHN|nr:hypothetical protein [Novosphingobium piscinae]MBC2668742.1 hypothetical protein [Novosphingobium piscinae]
MVPSGFDAPLGVHHKAIGRWLAERDGSAERITRGEARRYIETEFDKAVRAELSKVQLADLRVVALTGEDHGPPAIALICDNVGEIELGWITKANVLANALDGVVAPVGWRAAAYRALEQLLGYALPVFGFEEFMDEMSMWMWDGATDDADAIRFMGEFHGLDDIEEMTLPSHLRARRPDYMTRKPAPLKDMPPSLRDRLRRLRETCKALNAVADTTSAWRHDREALSYYLPHYEDGSCTLPLTLVPFDQFGQQLDEIADHAMQTNFYDIVGLTTIEEPARLDAWFESLRLGAEFIAAAQDLIDHNPMKDQR